MDIGIHELIKNIVKELKKIKEDDEIQESPLLSLRGLELDLKIAISKAGEGGIKFFIVTTGAEYRKEEISSVKLVFEPLVQFKPKTLRITTAKGEGIFMSPSTIKELKKLLESAGTSYED